jgi:hypothetical protein
MDEGAWDSHGIYLGPPVPDPRDPERLLLYYRGSASPSYYNQLLQSQRFGAFLSRRGNTVAGQVTARTAMATRGLASRTAHAFRRG